MPLFKKREKKKEPGSAVLPEPRLETAALEHAIVRANMSIVTTGVVGDGDLRARASYLERYFDSASDRLQSVSKNHEEMNMMLERAEYLRAQMESTPYEQYVLYARIVIDNVKSGGYGFQSFKVVFKAVPLWRLLGCRLYSGDERYTEDGHIIYAIGFVAPKPQLELIQQSLSKSAEFAKICSPKTPFKLVEELRLSEPLVKEGIVLLDSIGKQKDVYAANASGAHNSLKREGLI